MPLPGTRVLPANWSAHHRTTAEGVMTSVCQITRRPGTGTTNPDGGWSPGTKQIIFEGICRVVRDTGNEENPISGDRRLVTRRYEAQIPADAPEIITGDVLRITDGGADNADFMGRTFRVESVLTSSEQWTRNLAVLEFEEGT